MKTALPKIWTRVAMSISYGDNHGTSSSVWEYNIKYSQDLNI